MLFLQLCSIVLYQFNQNIEPNQTDIEFPYHFGFKKDGNYTIFITNGGNDSFILSIQPVDFYKYLKKDELHLACTDYNYSQNMHDNNHVIHLQNGKYNISGSINQENIYKTSIKFCSNHHNGFKIEGIYMNPNSSFGYDTAKVLKLYLITIHIRIIIFIMWLFNWMFYFSMKNILHLAFTFTAFIFIIAKIIDYYDYKSRYESNQLSSISIIRPYSDILREIVLLNTFFLINCCVSIEKSWRKTVYFKMLFLWIFYLIFYKLLYSICKKWVFYLIGFLVHIFVNDLIMIMSGVGDDDDEMIFILNQLKSFFYVMLVSIENAYDLRIEIDGYVVIDMFVVIMQSVMAFFFRMRNYTKNDYTNLFQHINFDYRQLITDDKIMTIPKNVTQINQTSLRFSSFANLETIIFEEGSQLMTISSYTFKNYTIKYIKIPPSVKEIFDFAFSNCKNLQYIEFLEKSQITVFNNILDNSSIRKINIPSSVVEIKDSWCSNVPCLEDIYISPQNNNFLMHNNDFVLSKSNRSTFLFDILIFARRGIRNAIIPSYIKRINPNAFKQCKKIRYITFSNDSKLFLIGENAFSESSIKEIIIPKNVSIIDESAFNKCRRLTKVVFENNSNLQKICDNAFKDSSIERIQIPSHVFSIGKNAFYNCSKLRHISILDNSNLTIIEKNAFDHSAIESFIVTSKVNFIGDDAFANCNNIHIIEFQENNFVDMLYYKIFTNSSQVIIMIPAKMIEYF